MSTETIDNMDIPDKDKYAELIEQVISFGIVDYPLDKILNILPNDVDHGTFTIHFHDTTHPIHQAYRKGQDRRDFDIDITLFNMAKSGDLKALEKYEERQFIRSKQKKKK